MQTLRSFATTDIQVKKFLIDAEEEEKRQDRIKKETDSETVAMANVAHAGSSVSRATVVCPHCKRSGHTEDRCWTKYPHLRRGSRRVGARHGNGEAPFLAPHHAANLAVGNYAVASTAISEESNANSPTTSTWLIDSGCSTHMCNDRSLFERMRPTKANTILFASGTGSATMEGDINVKVTTDGGSFTVQLHDVMYVPSLSRNLISAVRWAKEGVTCNIGVDGCTLKKGSSVIGRVKATNHVLPVTVTLASGRNEAHAARVAPNGFISSMELWHYRTGHQHFEALKRASTMVEGMNCSGSVNVDCEACMVGKMQALPHPHTAEHRATVPLELVHSDICGPLTVSSYDGFKYFITFIDDATRFTVVQLLRARSEAMTAFIGFKRGAEKQTGRWVKQFRSDGAAEYLSKDFNEYLRDEGIVRQTSAPYSQQQNGVSERYNRTVFEKARSMLMAAGLDSGYWSDAVLTATHIQNRMPTSALSGKTPFEAYFGHKPDVSHFRVFGCVAYALVPSQRRGKLDEKARVCVNLGNAPGYRAYKLMEVSTGAIIISRNVRFTEHVFASDSAGQVGGGGELDSVVTLHHQVEDDSAAAPHRVTNTSLAQSHHDSNSAPLAERAVSPAGVADNGLDVDDNDPEFKEQEHGNGHSSGKHGVTGLRSSSAPAGTLQDFACQWIQDKRVGGNTAKPTKKETNTMESEIMVSDDPSVRRLNIKEVVKEIRSQLSRVADMAVVIHQVYAAEVAADLSPTPRSRSEAMSSVDRSKWEKAEREEMDSITRAQTYSLVPLPSGHEAIGCRWVYAIKRDENGAVLKHKARLVCKGYTQREGVDYDETFSPVLRYSSLRALLAIAAHYDLEIHQMDVKTAFLNGKIDKEIYMRQPEGHVTSGQENLVCRLNKGLYGLKQAGRLWYERIHAELVALGFTRLACEHCTYIKRSTSQTTIIGLYVDDLLLIGDSRKELTEIKRQLTRAFEMKDMGEARFILGIKIERDRTARTLTISQTEYINTVVTRYGLVNSRRSTFTPMNTGVKLVHGGTVDDSDSRPVSAKEYQAMIGAIMYAMLGTRPDIAYAVSKLAQYCNDPRAQHMNATDQLLRYLATTSDYGITYTGTPDTNVIQTLVGYSDSDWAGDHDDRRSTTAWLFSMAGGVVSWKSRRQPTVALSTTEAEYMAGADAAREAVHWRSFLSELGFRPTAPTVIKSDNQGSIALTKNAMHHARTKHIDVRHHWIRELVASHQVEVVYVSTEHMLADALTKPLARDRHAALIKEMAVAPGATTPTRPLSGSVGIGTGRSWSMVATGSTHVRFGSRSVGIGRQTIGR